MSAFMSLTPLMPGAMSPSPLMIRRHLRRDDRGSFSRLFCAEELEAAGWSGPVLQVNHSFTSRRGTVRGMHFQKPPHADMKLVSCVQGAIFDVIVDIRPESPTFHRHASAELSAENGTAILVPEGFAHGFQALTDEAGLVYLHSAFYRPDFDSGLRPDDPALGIPWPLAVKGLSPRDAAHPLIDEGSAEEGA